MSSPISQVSAGTTRRLPPLILHPFGGDEGATHILEGSRAAVEVEQRAGTTDEVLERAILTGRYHEVRMLLFLGKDLFRWMNHCVDQLRRSEPNLELPEQSFAELVVDSPPSPVRVKLESWGVADRRAIFSRAIGIHSIFENPPAFELLAPSFLMNYHRYADHAYICFQHLRTFRSLKPGEFDFEIFASEEYSRLLARQWEQ